MQSNNLQNRKRKAPPLPKFAEKDQKIQNNNKQQLQSKLNDFLTSLNKPSPITQETKQPLDEKEKKKNTLASINSKLNSMLNSKKINLSKIEDPKATNNNQSKSIDSQSKNKRQMDVQYDPNIPNSYETSKHYYIDLIQSLAQNNKISNTNQPIKIEEEQTPKHQEQQLEQKEELALRIMQKLGYRVGEGLGKNGQGIKTPLTVKKTTDSSCIIQPSSISLNQIIKPQVSARNLLQAFGLKPTKVVVLVDIIKLSELTDEIQNQIKEQFTHFGRIVNWIIYMMGQQIRLFIEYQSAEQSFQAFLRLNNMYFNQNLVSIRFYNEQSFNKFELNLDLHQHLSF